MITCNRNTFSLFALTAALAFGSTFACASSITYDLVGATTPDGTVTGWVDINTTTGLITAADITFNDAAIGDPAFTDIGSPNTYNDLGQDYISGPSNGSLNWGGQIALYYDLTDLSSGGDLSICLSVGPCGTEDNQASFVQGYVSSGNGGPFDLVAGTLDPEVAQNFYGPVVSAAPEPSSLFLLGTGMIAAAILMARFGRSRPGAPRGD